MSSSSFECTHIRTTSNVACIMDPRHQRRLENIECRMSLSPFDCTHGRATYGVVCFSSPWTRYTVGRCRAPWTAHTLGRHRAWPVIISLGQHTRSEEVGHDLPSSPLDYTHGQRMSGVALHTAPWTAHMVRQRRKWHVIMALG